MSFGAIGNFFSNVYHAVTGTPHSSEKRAQQDAMNEQIRAYREQTELTRQELNRKKDETNAQKRRVEEKQIRSLRRNYRTQGLLNTVQNKENEMATKLGG